VLFFQFPQAERRMASPTDGNRDQCTSISAIPPPLQFGLRTIFVVTAIVAALAAGVTVGGADGVLVAIRGISFLGWISALATGRRRAAMYLGPMFWLAVVVFLAAALFRPAILSSTPVRKNLCQNNMHSIGLALISFESTKGSFPPAATIDANGKPLCSWRTLILPYLDRTDVYQAYRRDEPWDGLNNKSLSQLHIELFQCPSDAKIQPNETSYVAIIGPGMIWSAKGGTKLSDVTDGRQNTILFVEMRNSGIAWAEPRDLDLDHLPPGITKQNLLHSLSNHPGGFNAVFADGHVEFIPETIPWADFEAMLTIAGGEKVDRSKW
jgi:prepilin-type processing-associated H-X9-DG protein